MPDTVEGVLPILHTPFDARGEIDFNSLQREIDWCFQVGADGVGTGMVSELLRLSQTERLQLTEQIVACTAGRGCVVAAVGAETTRQASEYAKAAGQAGCDAVMALPPVTTSLPPTALLDYFRGIADGVSLPMIVQDASGYVGQAIPLSVHTTLLDQYGPDRILFKPEASPIGPNLSALRDATNGRARIFDGSGGVLLVDSFRRGIAGTMPGVDLLDGIVALWHALKQARDSNWSPATLDVVDQLSFPISAIVVLQLQAGLDGFLAIEKYLLVKRGLFDSAKRREPVNWSLDRETQSEVDRLFDRMQAAICEKKERV